MNKVIIWFVILVLLSIGIISMVMPGYVKLSGWTDIIAVITSQLVIIPAMLYYQQYFYDLFDINKPTKKE